MKALLLCTSVLALLDGCGSVVAAGPDAGPQEGPPPAARCDPQKPFAPPAPVANVNTGDDEIGFTLTRDELTAFVDHYDTALPGSNLLAARRSTATSAFATPSASVTGRINDGNGDEFSPFPSADGLTLFFARSVAGSPIRVVAAARPDADTAFSADLAVTVDGMDVIGDQPVVSSDGQTLYWVDSLTQQLQAATRGELDTVFVAQRGISVMPVTNPALSADELTLYYSNGAGADVLVSTRPTTAASFRDGVPVPLINTASRDAPVFLTSDGCVLYMKSDRPGGAGGSDLWEAHRPQ